MNRLSSDSLQQALSALSGFLEADGAPHEALVVIGGGASHWLNTGPADQVLAGLPEGFLSRLTRHDYGARVTIYFPGRLDLIHRKLFAIMDQGPGRHVRDLMALQPTDDEILVAARWVLTQDADEFFPEIVKTALKDLDYGHLVDQL